MEAKKVTSMTTITYHNHMTPIWSLNIIDLCLTWRLDLLQQPHQHFLVEVAGKPGTSKAPVADEQGLENLYLPKQSKACAQVETSAVCKASDWFRDSSSKQTKFWLLICHWNYLVSATPRIGSKSFRASWFEIQTSRWRVAKACPGHFECWLPS